MAWPSPRTVFAFVFALIISPMPISSAAAEDFRIQTRIFLGEDEKDDKPVAETTTLFHEGVVYDFLLQPEQWAVFRKPLGGKPGRFILLDPAYRVQTELTTQQLAGIIDKLRAIAAKKTDPDVAFALNPQFKESFDRESGQLILASHIESYTVETEPAAHAGVIPEYHEFLDWYTKLNTLQAGSLPWPRLKLNEALARHRALPVKVQRVYAASHEIRRAEHDFTWRLSREDLARIEDVRTAMASFREVDNEEFLRATQPAANN
jgi:hypothetical protein